MLKQSVIILITAFTFTHGVFANKHLRSATFINDITNDANNDSDYISAQASNNSKLSECPESPKNVQDCKDYGNCYYLDPPTTATYGPQHRASNLW
ncbi:hypothetical protein [Fangia hongkongensis]|uniref:hypothetical protein n=1 Tax=Fangia hongkongensis TaxID=270495 RepID=UPI000363DF05|nr:hypothetical protein [Fangia hongkongensis]MBK2124767.1 hypothetical protein [Fangia hongkongensis]